MSQLEGSVGMKWRRTYICMFFNESFDDVLDKVSKTIYICIKSGSSCTVAATLRHHVSTMAQNVNLPGFFL